MPSNRTTTPKSNEWKSMRLPCRPLIEACNYENKFFFVSIGQDCSWSILFNLRRWRAFDDRTRQQLGRADALFGHSGSEPGWIICDLAAGRAHDSRRQRYPVGISPQILRSSLTCHAAAFANGANGRGANRTCGSWPVTPRGSGRAQRELLRYKAELPWDVGKAFTSSTSPVAP